MPLIANTCVSYQWQMMPIESTTTHYAIGNIIETKNCPVL
jgi:hypothetical protein